MKKSIWIFLLAVLLPAVVLGWLALRSAEEQQIVFERRTAELYQKETEALAVAVRDAVEGERRAFGETVHRLLANGDPEALARDFTNTLADAWPRKAIGFALDKDGKLVSPTVASAAANPEWRKFLMGNGGFLSSSETALVYTWQADNQYRAQGWISRGKTGAISYSQSAQKDDSMVKTELASGKQVARKEMDKAAELAAVAPAPERLSGGMAGKEVPKLAPRATASRPADPLSGDAQQPQPFEAGAKMKTQSPMPAATAAPAEASKRNVDLPTAAGAAAPMPSAAGSAPKAVAATASADRKRDVKNDAPGAEVRGLQQRADTDAIVQEKLAKSREMEVQLQATAPAPQVAVIPDGLAYATKDEAKGQAAADMQNEQAAAIVMNRKVEPQQMLGAPGNAVSVLIPAAAEFRTLTEDSDEGLVSRFVQDKLDLIFWIRPPEAPEMVLGCLVEAADFSELWKGVLERHRGASRSSSSSYSTDQPEFVLALLNDRGRPAATSPDGAVARDWKRPFVASEIGESLPHWEAALYLASPTALADSARGLWRTLAFTIAGAVALIALGGWLVVADARRQLALAQQKTDFVSNVSHELKTPLTSIRMFAELMHSRPQSPEKQGQYLRIITVEAERLTRLINNVLDFARIGRKQKQFEKRPLDLHEIISRAWESQGLHLREAGFTTRWEAAPGPYPVLGDDDALSQVLVNLLSNAEKYSTERKEVELHTWLDDGWVNVSVLDRGMGVPNGEERKIFEAFYRAHDSLNSGIQGSGLGLTLAHHVAHEHGGEIRLEHRDGGGSRFTLRLPLREKLKVEC